MIVFKPLSTQLFKSVIIFPSVRNRFLSRQRSCTCLCSQFLCLRCRVEQPSQKINIFHPLIALWTIIFSQHLRRFCRLWPLPVRNKTQGSVGNVARYTDEFCQPVSTLWMCYHCTLDWSKQALNTLPSGRRRMVDVETKKSIGLIENGENRGGEWPHGGSRSGWTTWRRPVRSSPSYTEHRRKLASGSIFNLINTSQSTAAIS